MISEEVGETLELLVVVGGGVKVGDSSQGILMLINAGQVWWSYTRCKMRPYTTLYARLDDLLATAHRLM